MGLAASKGEANVALWFRDRCVVFQDSRLTWRASLMSQVWSQAISFTNAGAWTRAPLRFRKRRLEDARGKKSHLLDPLQGLALVCHFQNPAHLDPARINGYISIARHKRIVSFGSISNQRNV